MALLPLRKLPARSCDGLAQEWLAELAAKLKDPAADRALICRQTLCELWFPEYANDWETACADAKIPRATRLALLALAPRNVTLEPEYYAECDDERFHRVKPLLWLWYSFDRTPIGGQNIELGINLRRLLASHIFKRCGANFKA